LLFAFAESIIGKMDNSKDFYAKAASELAEIDGQIAALEKRRIVLRQFVDLGQKLYAEQAAAQQGGTITLVTTHRVPVGFGTPTAIATSREQSLKARVEALSKRAIQERGPQSTVALVDYIESSGVLVTGAHKPTTVSVILSRSDEFRNVRGTGWTLVESPQKELTP
jgi:hypothetical protein